jgi:hypothetical protein
LEEPRTDYQCPRLDRVNDQFREGIVTEEIFWYSNLEARASREAAIIVDAFGERGIDIGGETDWAEEDRDLHPVALPSCTTGITFSPANSISAG